MNEDIKTAIDCPRPHHQLVPMKIDYEIGVKQVKRYINNDQKMWMFMVTFVQKV